MTSVTSPTWALSASCLPRGLACRTKPFLWPAYSLPSLWAPFWHELCGIVEFSPLADHSPITIVFWLNYGYFGAKELLFTSDSYIQHSVVVIALKIIYRDWFIAMSNFFFRGLWQGLTNRVPVRDSDSWTPLVCQFKYQLSILIHLTCSHLP